MSEVRAQYELMLQTAINEGDENKRSFAEAKLAELDEQDQNHVEEVESIQLPHDYDTIWGRVGINREIQLLLRQVTEQLYSLHNDDLVTLQEAHIEKVTELETKLSEQAEQISQLQRDLQDKDTEIIETRGLVDKVTKEKHKLEFDLHHAEDKRDNAVMLMEEAVAERNKLAQENQYLKSQINELEALLRTYKKPTAPSGKLILTSSIKPETEAERKARIERERLETINRNLSEKYGIPPLPTLPVTQADLDKQHEKVTEAAEEAARFQTVVQGDSAGSEVPEGEEKVFDDARAEEIDIQALAKRVEALEAWKLDVANELSMMGVQV